HRLSIERDRGLGIECHALALSMEQAKVDHPGGVAEIGGPLVPRRGLGRVGCYPVAPGIHEAEIDHREHIAAFRRFAEEPYRLRSVPVDDLAVSQEPRQTV